MEIDGAGVWVTDVRSIAKYPDGSRVKHIAFFDVHPEDDVSITSPKTPLLCTRC
jgi:hypothetical protein